MAQTDWRERWGIVLAGGDGTRLHPRTRRVAGDERPKQFSSILGDDTLLHQTWRRASLSVRSEQTLTLLTRTHEPCYQPLLADVAPRSVIAQPANRGTAPALLYALLRLARRAPGAARVAVFPSDHYVSDDGAFMAHVDMAFDVVGVRPDLVILLGIAADCAETEYGWTGPGAAIPGLSPAVAPVRRFWEKPSADVARVLLKSGCLWNSFVMVADITTLLALIAKRRPDLYDALDAVIGAGETAVEREAVRMLYARLGDVNFSRTVLGTQPADLAVLPVRGVDWSDLGLPDRVVHATLRKAGLGPDWATEAVAGARASPRPPAHLSVEGKSQR